MAHSAMRFGSTICSADFNTCFASIPVGFIEYFWAEQTMMPTV